MLYFLILSIVQPLTTAMHKITTPFANLIAVGLFCVLIAFAFFIFNLKK